MGAPISVEVRERAVAAYLSGLGSYEYVASVFSIGSASLKRWVRRKVETGTVEPTEHRHGPPPVIDDNGLDVLEGLCDEQPDRTLPELQELYNRRRRTAVSVSTIGRAIRNRLNLPRKKRAT
jgi:transposase